MELSPYLMFDGNCAEAFRFYEKVLGGKITFSQTYGESPAKEHVPAAAHDRVIHIHMTVGTYALMGSDAPEHYEKPQGTHVTIATETPAEAERIFTALADGGKVTMPFGQTFWSSGFGMTVDRFGTPWMVNAAPAKV